MLHMASRTSGLVEEDEVILSERVMSIVPMKRSSGRRVTLVLSSVMSGSKNEVEILQEKHPACLSPSGFLGLAEIC